MKWLGSQTGLENAELIEVTQVSLLWTLGASNKLMHKAVL